ncbi:NAD(P)-dependent oxidoreductase [Streptomyces sp. NPDC047061]|uniref:NAD(P)-dependent oxidoreductase n=1 Tax=Streptomyces sp. NPDC047061 TaxID=3154605 RepID=UPI0033D1C8B1
MKIGFIGPGRMGRPMIDRLVEAGHDVTVHARRSRTRSAVQADGLTAADTVPATVEGADAVFVAVLTDQQVRATCLGVDGAIAAMAPGTTLVQHTTCDPGTLAALAEAGATRGVDVLDAALSGGPHDIRAGSLTLWVGGDEAVLHRVRPLLESYASPVLHVGAPGDGQRVKLVNNALFVAQVGLVVDAVRIAASLGVPEPTILAALGHGSGASRALAVVARGGSVDSVADRLADLMRKDVGVVREVADRAGADLGVIGAVLASDAVEERVLRTVPAPKNP